VGGQKNLGVNILGVNIFGGSKPQSAAVEIIYLEFHCGQFSYALLVPSNGYRG
jgi:hypothetical protein